MAVSNNIPISEVLRSKSICEDEPKKKSREDWRKAKELEEARKAGTAPAAVDEEGKDINPHIPQYISSAPWYFGSAGPTLKHQRIQPEEVKKPTHIDLYFKRGVDVTKLATKFRKGACENCGAMTHKKKECMERPRKVGAKYTGVQLAPDEFIQDEVDRDYDAKRDRWVGYDPAQHRTIIEQYHKIEEAKRQLRAEKLNSENADGKDEDLDEEEDEDKYVDAVDMPGTKVDSKQRITVRNLRIREDTAKYLRNLDPNSAYYDPKTRSMRDNPHEGTSTEDDPDVDYAGENFVRFTGDTRKHAKAQLFAWEAYEKGVDVHLLAEPTKLEMLQHDYEGKKDQFKKQVQSSILDKYGGEEHLDAPPKQLLLAQTEDYVEYNRYGKVIKGQDKSVVRSKYEEDTHPNNHTSVWGSYWYNGSWGYKCCHSFIKESYCTGESGKAAFSLERNEILSVPTATNSAEYSAAYTTDTNTTSKKNSLPESSAKRSSSSSSSSSSCSSSSSSSSSSSTSSSSDSENDKKLEKKKSKKKKIKKNKNDHNDKDKNNKELTTEEKIKAALEEEEKRQREVDRILKMDERKRPYNSMFQVKKPTDEEMEAYYMKRNRSEDPMADFT